MLEEKGTKEKAEESNVYRIFVSGDFTAYHQFDKTVDVKRVYTSMCVTMSGGFELIYSFVKK